MLLAMTVLAAAALLGLARQEVRAQSDPASDPDLLTVVTKDIEPFVFVNGEDVSGFSIDLWEAIALEAGLPFDYLIVESVIDQLDAVAENRADAAIAAISITEEREMLVDFSLRYFESGLGILIKDNTGSGLLDAVRLAFSPSLLRLMGILAITIIIAGHVIWLIERRRNPEFPQAYWPGVWEGVWWSAVTVTTVGYGDRTPIGRLGRLFGILWMFAGFLIIANFTASVTSQLTLQQLRGSIRGPEDLAGHRVVTVIGSTGDIWLAEQGIRHSGVETIEDAYALLDNGRVDAIVYDRPVLLYYESNHPHQGYRTVPNDPFRKEIYGIAFPEESPLRESINLALLRLIEDGTYDHIYDRWFVDANSP